MPPTELQSWYQLPPSAWGPRIKRACRQAAQPTPLLCSEASLNQQNMANETYSFAPLSTSKQIHTTISASNFKTT